MTRKIKEYHRLGDESGIPQDVENDFRATGTSHIIAISGHEAVMWVEQRKLRGQGFGE